LQNSTYNFSKLGKYEWSMKQNKHKYNLHSSV
jgi:hypothetical protein